MDNGLRDLQETKAAANRPLRRTPVGRSFGSKVFDGANVVLMFLIMAAVLLPFIHIISVSFSDADSIAKGQVSLWPKGFTAFSYDFILKDRFVYTGYLNSILYAAGSALLMLLFTSLIAYPLTVRDFPLNKFITVFLTITMFFGGGLIPTYLLMRDLDLTDTYWVMVLPGCVYAYNVFVFRTFFNNIPLELRESALLDGANDILVLFRIILPLSKALLSTFALFTIIGSWNSWFNGLIYLEDQEKYPLQLILRNYLYVLDAKALEMRAGASGSSAAGTLFNMKLDPKSVRMAMIVVTMFPIMLIYPFFQKHFVKGVMIGAVKG